MNTATIAQTQDKGLRQQFTDLLGKIRQFSIELYMAHGGYLVTDAAQPASGALAQDKQQRQQKQSLARLFVMGNACEQYAPGLANDMTHTSSN